MTKGQPFPQYLHGKTIGHMKAARNQRRKAREAPSCPT